MGSDLLPTIRIGSARVTRLIVGGNPFSGNSHQGRAMDVEMRNYYTVQRIKDTLRQCEKAGINTWQSRGDNFITRVLNEYRMEGGSLQWIAQTASERRDTIANIHQIAQFEPIAVYHHGTRTDRLYLNGKLEEVGRYIDEIRSLGFPAGVGTHLPEVVLRCEEMGLNPDFYMLSFYNCTDKGDGYDPEDRVKACEVMRRISRPFLAFKVMAAGRNDPMDALRFAFRNIKPTDAVVVGVYTKNDPDQVFENASIARYLLGKGQEGLRHLKFKPA